MEKLQKLILLFSLILLSFQTIAQTGMVRGQLIDDKTAESIPFANIIVQEMDLGFSTDLDGYYSVDLPLGTYTFKVSYIGYAELIVSEIEVKEAEVTILDMRLKEEGEVIQEVVVTAKAVRNTEAALLTLQRRSANVLNGISSQNFKRTGDGDAGEAIKRVTGVSVEGGKHVYVRGLGDRYTKTILNGMEIPGLDPDRNSVELDIFPTNLIDNIVVLKTASPDLPADFTGGVVNITTKDFPESKIMNVSLSSSYNPDMHFNSNFLSYKGGGTDWLGMDDGTRALPFSKQQAIPEITGSFIERNAVTTFTSMFSPNMASTQSTNDLNKSLSFSLGNQMNLDQYTIGYIGAINYKSSSSFYENAEYNEYIILDNEFIKDRDTQGSVGESNVFWSAMGGISAKHKNHKLSLQYTRLQNGLSSAANLTQKNLETNPSIIVKDNLEYQERSVDNLLVSAKHSFNEGKLKLEWKFAPTFIEVDEPDIRFSAFELTDEGYEIRPAVGADVSRTYRNLQESNYNSKLDLTYEFKSWTSESSKIKLGFFNNIKERDFGIVNYLFRVRNQFSLDLQGNSDNLLLTDNLWTDQNNTGTYVRGNFEPANSYNAIQNIYAAYLMNELSITEKFKAIYGVRMEQVHNYYTGQTNDGSVIYNDVKVLDELDILPSLNTVYNLTDNSNLRLSISKTVARPSFKEKSLAQIQDRISGRTFLGNIELEETKILNLDLRWELFANKGQMLSISSFAKSFDKPIELVSFDASAPSNFQAKNGGDAKVYGIEFEFRKDLSFISENWDNIHIGSNITAVHSEIEIENESKRQMVGQSPFIINTVLNYRGKSNGFEANVSYNYQAERLLIAGLGSIPDVFDVPFHSLNFKASKRLINNNFSFSLGVDNILNQNRAKEYRTASDETGIFELLRPGRQINIGLSYTIR